MRIGFIAFLIIAFTLIFGAHAFLHFSWVRFFSITSPKTWRLMAIAFALLSISFLGSSVLAHRYENPIVTAIYYLSSIWLGLFLYLLLAAISTWLLFLSAKVFGIGISLRFIGGALIALAILVSSYGIWNAAFPALKEIQVSLKNLPATWSGKKAVQISDLHLGSIRGRGFTQRIVGSINTVKPDIVFITGDLFDGMGDNLKDLVEPLNSLNPLMGTYFITGNHETYLGVDKALAALAGTNVKILRDEVVDLDGVQLLGLDFGGSWDGRKLDSVFVKLDKSKPNIVLYHSPSQIDKFKAAGVNLQLAGHTHRGQLWPFNYITRAVYNGFDYGFFQDGDYALYTSCGTGTWGPPMRTGSRSEIVVINFK